MTTTRMRLCDTQDAGGLIPGDVRTVAAAQADLDRTGAVLSDTATALGAITTSTTAWSGPAAGAFTRHTHDVGDTLDRWEYAHHLASQALTGYQERLTAAQDTAARALVLWRTARAQLAQLTASAADAVAASNLDSLRVQLTAALRHAAALLDRASTELAAAGDNAARQVICATHQLHEQPLPALSRPHATIPAADADHTTAPSGPTVTVQAPHAGIHDSLSRIAARTLGDARRWPEIYRLNTDRLGRNPNLIQPGWTLRLPATADAPPAPDHPSPAALPAIPGGTPRPLPLHHPAISPAPAAPDHRLRPPVPPSGSHHTPSPTTAPPGMPHTPPPAQPNPGRPAPLDDGPGRSQPTAPPTSPTVPAPPPPMLPQPGTATLHTSEGGGVHLGNGVLLAGGVVAGLAVIVGTTAVLRHRHGTAGEGPDALDAAASAPPGPSPVVRRLAAGLADSGPTNDTAASSLPNRTDQFDLPLGECEGRTVLLDAATTFGLGLTGPGALPAARALLLSVLTTHPAAHAVLAVDDLHALALAPAGTGHRDSRRLSVPGHPADALAHLEAAILTRTRLLEESAGQHTPPPLLLVISVPTDPRRLQAIADLGAGLAITVLVLGPWPAGLTCHISADGQITTRHGTQDPDWTTTLDGLHAYTADADTTRDLLALLDQDPAPTARHRPSDPTGQSIPQPITPLVTNPTPPPALEPDPQPSDIAHRLTPDREPDTPTSRLTPARAITTSTATPRDVNTSETNRGHTPRPRTPDSPTTDAPTTPIRLTIVGHFQLLYHTSTADTPSDITDRFSPREREILTYLAVHPDGTRRDTLIAALWPDNPGGRPAASLHARLSHMRHTLRTVTDNQVDTLITHHDGYYGLDPDTVDVDLWHLTEALHTHYHATDSHERTAALHQIAELYQGHLAEAITGDWIETPRQALHRDALDAFATLIRTIREANPHHALELLEHARTLDPHNEAIYRDIIRLQRRLGHHDSVPRTIELLHTALAEIDATPMPSTLALASGQPNTTHPDATAPPHT